MPSASPRLSLFGLGYVGCVSAACFAARGCTVVGVDPQRVKVEMVEAGASPIVEPALEPMIAAAVADGRLSATDDAVAAVAGSDISLVCVGTPSQANGNPDMSAIARVCEEIGAALREKAGPHIVVIRSTMLPGSARGLVLPTLEAASGKRAGEGFGLAVNPEFLREGSAVSDFNAPPKTVVGALDEATARAVAALYEGIAATLFLTTLETAETVKLIDNAWHALKIAFGNEVGTFCKAQGIDSHAVMDIFLADTKLNISPNYLRPGFAFGGSCLPKDLRALLHKARSLDLSLPVLEGVLPSNREQVEQALRRIAQHGRRRIGVLGFAFKAGTDDLRESPVVELIERLIGKGYDLRLFDHSVNLARLVGANRDYILRTIPHIAKLMVASIEEVLDHADLVVVGTGDARFRDIPTRLRPGQVLLDLVRLPGPLPTEGYDGINW